MQTKTKQGILFGVGAALVLIGSVVGGCWMFIYDYIIKSQLTLTDTSTTFDIWKDIPLAIYMEFNMFNVTNAAEVERDPSVLPHVVQMGPYVWREYHLRVNFTWNKDNHTVTHQQLRRWEFEPDLSNGDLTDMVTNFNVIAATTAFGGREMPYVMRLVLSHFLDKSNSTLFVTHSVQELIFDGYDDTLLELANTLNTTLFDIPFTRFGYFIDRNDSAEYDGWFNMNTGADDLYKMALITRWNYERYTGYYGRPCDEVKGSSGDLWPPIRDYNDIHIFLPDFCLALPLTHIGEIRKRGVDGLAYEVPRYAFDNGSTYPERSCLCNGECVPAGAVNVSACKWGAPLFLSLPHFLHADPYYLTLSQGLDPDPDKHMFQYSLNPASGIPLVVNGRLQLNLMISDFPDIRLFEGFKERRFVPMFWFDQRTEIDGHLSSLARLLRMAPQLGQGILFGLAGVGALLLLAGFAVSLRHTWRDPEEAPLVSDAAADYEAART